MTYSRRIGLAPIWVALALAALLLAITVVPAFASIDPIVESECAAQDSQSDNSGSPSFLTAGDNQHPPGQTPKDGIGDGGDVKGVSNADGNATSGEGSANCTNP